MPKKEDNLNQPIVKEKKKITYKVNTQERIPYDEKYGHMLIEHMATGKSLATFQMVIGASEATWRKWLTHAHFAECKKMAKLASMGMWEDIALMQAMGTIKGNASALIFTLKNRFSDHYKDKHEVEQTGNVVFKINTGIPDKDSIDFDDDNIIENADYSVKEDDSELL